MDYKVTKPLPALSEVMKIIHERCFPTLRGASPYQYVKACNDIPFNLKMEISKYDNSELGRLGNKLESFDRPDFFLKTEFFMAKKSEQEESLANGLNPFIDWNAKNASSWFSGKTKSMNGSTLYRGAVFYSLGLLHNAECKSYIDFIFNIFGIDEDVDKVFDCATLLDWKEELVLFTTYVLLGCSNGEGWTNKKLGLLERFIQKKMEPVRGAMLAEQSWLYDVSSFRPRSVEDNKGSRAMQDFYVRLEFSSQEQDCDEPILKLSTANSSLRQLIVARTGMGKSMYIRMAALCMCRELLEHNEKNALLMEKMTAPTDKYVIYIPAYMFSYCFQKTEYKLWTEDFITLYFNCMFRLSSTINFDKREFREKRVDFGFSGNEITPSLLQYISALAYEGRLILVADSFDEIVFGEMRTAYLSALRRFNIKYCNAPEGIGAHMLVTSREMSHATMEDLAGSIGIKLSSKNVMRINPLSVTQQKELIMNWDRHFKNDIRSNISQLDNHFFTEMGSNPYMLSIICCYTGAKLNVILDKLISAILIYRIQMAANSLENELLRSVLESKQIKSILQDLAFDTVQLSSPHFSLDILAKHCQLRFADLELSQEEFDYCYDVIISLFTTSVGLIVPADNEDDRFQFISDSIRCELAASKLSGEATKCGSDEVAIQYCTSFANRLQDDKAYVDLVVPLICKTGRIPLAEAMIRNLVLRSYTNENEWLINRALIDLVMKRYGLNITSATPSKTDPAYQYYLNADRMIIMRLLSAPNFTPTESEKRAILESNAFRVCDGFINESQRKSLI